MSIFVEIFAPHCLYIDKYHEKHLHISECPKKHLNCYFWMNYMEIYEMFGQIICVT